MLTFFNGFVGGIIFAHAVWFALIWIFGDEKVESNASTRPPVEGELPGDERTRSAA
jgi:hypothetical protein